MNKLVSILMPVLMILAVSFIGQRFLTSGVDMGVVLPAALILGVMIFVFRSAKKGPTKNVSEVAVQVKGEFARDAFAQEPALADAFNKALSDYCSNMPKGAIAKLEKLAPQCTNDVDRYAVAMALGTCHSAVNKTRDAVREYNKALVIHPTPELACSIGMCHQRNGDIEKAQDAYEFAIELDPSNAPAYSQLATTYVADWDYDGAIETAQQALDLQPDYAQALATMAISYGMLNDALHHKHYLKLAIAQGYKEEKITSTIDALKKRSKQK